MHLVVPGTLNQLTGGYLYDRYMVEGLRTRGWDVRVHEIDGTFPFVDRTAETATAQALAAIPNGDQVVVDALALPACVNVLPGHGARLYLVALYHLPLAAETGLTPRHRDIFERLERRALTFFRRVIVTSPYIANVLTTHGITPDRIGTVVPGTDSAGLSQGSGGGPLTLLCVGTVTPRKGHVVLVEALARLQDLDWRLLCIGSLQRHPATVAALQATIAQHRLEARMTLIDERPPEDVAAAYQRADVFVLASYYESYGMVLSEALARGLPIVSTMGGAIPDTVPAAAGLLVPPGDVSALAQALRRVIGDHDLRQRLAAGARQTRRHLTTWSEAVSRFARELERARAV
ncbi:D-inositol-3-phosphate glycosyltransferase [Candidatus Entotheonellaceae bacterium PAL068K]